MKVYGLISVSLLIMQLLYITVNPEYSDNLISWLIVIGWGVFLATFFESGFLFVLILPITYWLCLFIAGKGKYLVWLNYRPNSYVLIILLAIVWILVLYVTTLFTGVLEPFVMTPCYVMFGSLVTVSCKKLIRQYRMNTDHTVWSLLLIFTILLYRLYEGYPLITVPLILTILTVTAFGENWHIIPRNHAKYFLIIDMIILLIFIVCHMKVRITTTSLMLFIGCTILTLILLKLHHRLYMKKQIE